MTNLIRCVIYRGMNKAQDLLRRARELEANSRKELNKALGETAGEIAAFLRDGGDTREAIEMVKELEDIFRSQSRK